MKTHLLIPDHIRLPLAGGFTHEQLLDECIKNNVTSVMMDCHSKRNYYDDSPGSIELRRRYSNMINNSLDEGIIFYHGAIHFSKFARTGMANFELMKMPRKTKIREDYNVEITVQSGKVDVFPFTFPVNGKRVYKIYYSVLNGKGALFTEYDEHWQNQKVNLSKIENAFFIASPIWESNLNWRFILQNTGAEPLTIKLLYIEEVQDWQTYGTAHNSLWYKYSGFGKTSGRIGLLSPRFEDREERYMDYENFQHIIEYYNPNENMKLINQGAFAFADEIGMLNNERVESLAMDTREWNNYAYNLTNVLPMLWVDSFDPFHNAVKYSRSNKIGVMENLVGKPLGPCIACVWEGSASKEKWLQSIEHFSKFTKYVISFDVNEQNPNTILEVLSSMTDAQKVNFEGVQLFTWQDWPNTIKWLSEFKKVVVV